MTEARKVRSIRLNDAEWETFTGLGIDWLRKKLLNVQFADKRKEKRRQKAEQKH